MASAENNSIKKDLILKAASTIFSKKGFQEASISEIAGTAGVSESIIYEFFEGKEGLLFTIPIEKTNILIESLSDHLRGLKGTESKLRKVIWHYLNFHESDKEYASLVLFELRANRRFYLSEAYNSFKQYNSIVINIIREGKEEGLIHEKANIYLVRNLIFGALDHIILSHLLFNKPENLVAQADDLFEIILRASRSQEWSVLSGNNNDGDLGLTLDKRKIIMRVAGSIFAEKGFDKTRISDIAKALRIGEATLYEYFENKEDILFSIPLEKTEKLKSLMQDIDKNMNAEMHLRSFVWSYMSLLQANKNYLTILLFELRANRRFYSSKAYQHIKEYSGVLTEILREGQESKTFRKDVNIYLVRHMIFGSIDHIALSWLLFGKPPRLKLLGHADELIWLFLKALK